MFRQDMWAYPPGLTGAVETYENAFRWGPAGLGLITGAYISSLATDPGNVGSTFELRPGLVLGQRTADGTWTNYSPTNTDGSEVAAGVLITAIRMTDIITQVAQPRFYGILVGGPVQAGKLFVGTGGIDLYARACMSDHFWFDDAYNFPGNHWFPWRRFQTKTANYQVAATDNFTLFDNTGATGNVTFTLPPIAAGYFFGFSGRVAHNLAITSTEGGNIVAINNAAASTLTFQTGSEQIGALARVYTNPAGTLWISENVSSSTAVLTPT